MLTRLAVRNYRSLQSIELPFASLSVISGANGVGKSAVLQAIALLQAAASGGLSQHLAAEGGLGSALWAGPRASKRGEPVRMSLEADLDLGRGVVGRYHVALGPPRPTDAALPLDPVVKEERVAVRAGASAKARWSTMLQRKGPALSVRNADGRLEAYGEGRSSAGMLPLFQTGLSALEEPELYPELAATRRALEAIRIHHEFRADAGSPLRAPQPLIAAATVDADGANWAGALYSRIALSDGFADIERSPAAIAIAEAFDGARLAFFPESQTGVVEAGLHMSDAPRPFRARELSDGTLRFLALVATLTALRPPAVLALNEPEASLHPSLAPPLADLIAALTEDGRQAIVATHADALANRLEVEHAAQALRLAKVDGATRLVGQTFEDDDAD